jgi:hypothetical protein
LKSETGIDSYNHPTSKNPENGTRLKKKAGFALLPKDFKAAINADFANDVQAAVESHRESAGLLCMGVILDSSVLIAAERQGDLTNSAFLRASASPR